MMPARVGAPLGEAIGWRRSRWQKALFLPVGDSAILFCFAAHGAPKKAKRKGGRVVECAGLEIQCTVTPYRRFESDPFRQEFNEINE